MLLLRSALDWQFPVPEQGRSSGPITHAIATGKSPALKTEPARGGAYHRSPAPSMRLIGNG
jgi:hypothetical protein